MENDSTPKSNSTNTKNNISTDVIKQLQADRLRIAEHASLPSWYHPALVFVAVMYVVAPALSGGHEQNSGFLFALVATIVLVSIAQKKTGIKLGGGGIKRRLVSVAMLITVLIGFIVTLGLVSFELNWWAVIPALAVFMIIFALSRAYEKIVKAQITRER